MLTLRKLIDYITAEPFRPFRINMASGQTFEVRHPENIAISKSTAKVYAPEGDSNGHERWHDVSMMLMESIEPIDAPVAEGQA